MLAACVLAACVLAGPIVPGAMADAGGFLRVDQLGYAAGAPKRAYLMSARPEAGAPFAVLGPSAGTVAYRGTVGASLGSWSEHFPHVYALDFDPVGAPGSYTIEVGGGAPASAPITVAPATELYEAPLANALSFYQNERDGPDFIPSPLRSAPGHLNDEHASTYQTPQVDAEGEFKGGLTPLGETIDAAGGWWDAGDYLKFVQTTSYTVDLQLIGVRDFPALMGASSPHADFTQEARFGLEWLLAMWDDTSRTLYYQVGIGAGNAETVSDHDIWRLPQADDTYGGSNPRFRYIRNRPVFRAGPPGSPVSPNLAGRDAAAFALCYQVFARTRPQLAARCLLAGEHIFELANVDPHGRLLSAIPYGFYPETEWRDDLELGATELADALSSGGSLPPGLPHAQARYYLEAAAHWAHAYIAQGVGEPLNLYDVGGLADYELVRALRVSGGVGPLAVSEGQLIGNLRSQLQAAATQAQRDPFGFGFPWASYDTVSHGDGLAVMASEYDYLTGEDTYGASAARWLGNVLGANAWGSSFIIDGGTTFPDCPQHQVANLVGSLDGGSPVLAGAVVEGPSVEPSAGSVAHMRPCPRRGGNAFARFDNGARYRDDVISYTNTEPAIDLTASSMLAFSWQAGTPAPLTPGPADEQPLAGPVP